MLNVRLDMLRKRKTKKSQLLINAYKMTHVENLVCEMQNSSVLDFLCYLMKLVSAKELESW